MIIARPSPDEHAPYQSDYIAKVSGDDLLVALDAQTSEFSALLETITEEQSLHRYAPGKWSIRECVGHINDSERIFHYRALRIARADPTPLPGFDQDIYIAPGRFDARALSSLRAEFEAIRQGTMSLIETFDADAWARRGAVWDYTITVRAIGWVIAGHVAHHAQILREKYLA